MTKSINWFLTLSSTIFFGHSLEPFLDRDEGGKSTKPLFDPSPKLHGGLASVDNTHLPGFTLFLLSSLGLLNDPKKNLVAVPSSGRQEQRPQKIGEVSCFPSQVRDKLLFF